MLNDNSFDLIRATAVCINCKHRKPYSTCTAFPKGIPDEILSGDNHHTTPLKEQSNKIVFESVPEKFVVPILKSR